jgi:hypothetical protein
LQHVPGRESAFDPKQIIKAALFFEDFDFLRFHKVLLIYTFGLSWRQYEKKCPYPRKMDRIFG